MQRVYEPRDLLEAEMLLGMLAGEGIRAHLAGRHLVGAIGELPTSGLLALQVESPDAERARQLIAAYNAARPLEMDEPERGEPESIPGHLLC